ncbi:MAG: beta-ketoacyl-ACP synthase II [Oscillospiraceae bacterium]|nr:beta-ketoacyl-ACP synthase II [Oscillospiraceae bacterium]
MMKRVVVTGLGAITPIGNNIEEYWDGLKQCKNGIDKITLFDSTGFNIKLVAEVKNFVPEEHFDRKELRNYSRFSQFAAIASREAFKDSGLNMEKVDPYRVGIIIGSGVGGLKDIEDEKETLMEKGPSKVSPMFVPRMIANIAPGNISIELGMKGVSMAVITACASATHSIGEAYRYIKYGEQDVVFCGGTESNITPLGIAGFSNIKAVSTSLDKNRASIPFDKERSGFVMGEGAGVIVLEELEHAVKRGAKIYAEMVGYAATSDAYHLTAPSPDGAGAAKAMCQAMEMANAKPEDISYINAHGTSTKINDKVETIAIKLALKEEAKNVAISSTKSMTGHLLGAAGGVEAIACIKAIENDFIPATINYKEQDPECDLYYVPNEGINRKVNYAMSNSLGFGGHNSTILFKKYVAE